MAFRDNLREALDYSGLEQKEVAYKANLPLRTFESYLREGGAIPAADKAVQIAQALGVTVEYLVTGKHKSRKIAPTLELELAELIRSIENLPANKQRIVIKNALYLAGSLKQE